MARHGWTINYTHKRRTIVSEKCWCSDGWIHDFPLSTVILHLHLYKSKEGLSGWAATVATHRHKHTHSLTQLTLQPRHARTRFCFSFVRCRSSTLLNKNLLFKVKSLSIEAVLPVLPALLASPLRFPLNLIKREKKWDNVY